MTEEQRQARIAEVNAHLLNGNLRAANEVLTQVLSAPDGGEGSSQDDQQDS